uniref:2Fe-2S ferredoxin-type domain-containing protein n=1 Tax=Cryptomonas curvata TaxID=233186 RepID=A0A7S0M046_9CRYP|mmetsp:Transcript_18575/g.39195  ORF Transcript_18575/g.39195 Transcript_18575/m.39195 type:complete len:177 (+) Transcript_18575:21-551(+)
MAHRLVQLGSASVRSLGRQMWLRPAGFARMPGDLHRRCQETPALQRSFTRSAPMFSDAEAIPFTFLESRGGKDGIKVKAKPGKTLLEVARDNDIELEGACEGTLACSTCHCVFEKAVFDRLPPVTEEEMDMLDLAAGLTDTSRLGCQVKVSEVLRDTAIRIPDEFNNLYGGGSGSA